MFRLLVTIAVGSAALSGIANAQENQLSPIPARTAPTLPTMPSLPPGIGPQIPPTNPATAGPALPPMPGAAGMPPTPGAPAGIGPRSMSPAMNEPAQIPAAVVRQQPPQTSASFSSLISLLDSTALYVQAFDFVLMLIAGIYCLRSIRARKNLGLTILAISCFVSAIILLGFFLFGIFQGRGAFPQTAYIVARLLAPFELLLFVIAIVIIARKNKMGN